LTFAGGTEGLFGLAVVTQVDHAHEPFLLELGQFFGRGLVSDGDVRSNVAPLHGVSSFRAGRGSSGPSVYRKSPCRGLVDRLESVYVPVGIGALEDDGVCGGSGGERAGADDRPGGRLSLRAAWLRRHGRPVDRRGGRRDQADALLSFREQGRAGPGPADAAVE